MKYLGSMFAVLGLFLMLAVGCNSSTDDASAGNKEEAGTGNIAQVQVGMTEQEVIDLLGEPMGTSEYEYTGENGLIYRDEQKNAPMWVWFKDGKVTSVQASEGTSDSPWNLGE